METINFDNAATTPIDKEVLDILMVKSRDIIGNPSSTHSLGQLARVEIEKSRNTIANLLNVRSTELFFTSGATEAINLIIQGISKSNHIKQFIVSSLEHHAVLHSLEQSTIPYSFINHNKKGEIDLSHLEELLNTSQKACVIVMAVNNEIGNINPLAQIAAMCKRYEASFFSDMVQAVGKTDLCIEDIDFASFSAHKFYGPKGVGFAYIRSGNRVAKLLHGGGQEQNMRAGTENLPSIVAMAKAMTLAFDNFENNNTHISTLKSYFISQLRFHFPTIVFNGITETGGVPHIINFSLPNFSDMDSLHILLDMNGIYVSQGSACSSGAVHTSHVINALKNGVEQAIRVSFGNQNTIQEIDVFMQTLKRIVYR